MAGAVNPRVMMPLGRHRKEIFGKLATFSHSDGIMFANRLPQSCFMSRFIALLPKLLESGAQLSRFQWQMVE
jgi:hypothetical protein